jgi:deoxyribodipyrimidine photolyase
MPKTITIQLSTELEQQLLRSAREKNTTIESLALQSFQKHYGMNPDLRTANINILIDDYQQFINHLQQKYPAQTPEAAFQPIIDAECKELQKTQPQRWQNFLSLKRLWNGGKKATFKVGEHFTEENPWGKAAIAFLEGIAEDSEL